MNVLVIKGYQTSNIIAMANCTTGVTTIITILKGMKVKFSE